MKFLGKKKGFTLIEMLIVIVIIGVLASALIPRLSSARGKANDVARKADIQQVATALITYQIDNNKFPSTGTTIDKLKDELTKGGLASLPKDSSNANLFSGVSIVNGEGGYYPYRSIVKNGITDGGFVIMAQTETEGGSNYVFCPGITAEIGSSTDYDNIILCSTISKTNNCGNTSGTCTYSGSSQLRYIYKY